MKPRKLFKKIITEYGSEAKLAVAIGYTQNAVHQAKRRGTVTMEMASLIEQVSEGKYDRFALCPEKRLLRRLRRKDKIQ